MAEEKSDWVEPKTLEEARSRLAKTTEEVVDIQTQLGDLNKQEKSGRRVDFATWNQWRQRAKSALRFKLREQRKLKNWITARVQSQRDASEHLRTSLNPGIILKQVTKQVGLLMNVFAAAERLLEDDSDEAYTALEETVKAARQYLVAPE